MRSSSAAVRFDSGGEFQADLSRRVRAYFEGSGRSRHGGLRLALKNAFMLAWVAASWVALMFGHFGPVAVTLLAVSLGLAMAGVGFCVMHDANHGATSTNGRVNAALGFSSDLMGASSTLWKQKHNVEHHTYTNLGGKDPDLEGGTPWLRFAPWQELRPWHRFQHLYVWLLYAFFPLKWWFVDDVVDVVKGKVRGRKLVAVIAGKVLFTTWAFVLPAWLHFGWGLVGVWALSLFTLGNMIGAVFQLAHCVDQVEFVQAGGPRGCWAEHQLSTTMDFARGNALATWYLGGLNFQVEHHLFSRISHVHYRALSRMVEETSQAHGLRYRSLPSVTSALRANLRWLRQMGTVA